MLINPQDKESLKKGVEYFNKLIKGNTLFIIERKFKPKSVKNNAYLHVCITLYAIEFGYTLQEAKTQLKRQCGFMIYKKNNTLFLKTVSKLNDSKISNNL